MSDADLLARLAWLPILPLGIAQMVLAGLIGRRLGLRLLGAAAVTAGAALVAGVLSALLVDDRRTLFAIAASLYFVPGLPLLIALLRQRMWGLAAVLFVAPPALVLVFTA